MPLQNRVTPFGTLIAAPERGTLMGNRGCLHNDRQQIKRNYQLQRWIICVLEFKDRHRTVMKPGHYTELFFLDEATALAAGHRPCAECQRSRFNLFRDTWAKANPELTSEKRPTAPVIDGWLHHERLNGGHSLDLSHSFKRLPNGTFITFGGMETYMTYNGELFRWTPARYEIVEIPKKLSSAIILTPRSIVRTLETGYQADIHPSVFRA